jgi:hypothetical protein
VSAALDLGELIMKDLGEALPSIDYLALSNVDWRKSTTRCLARRARRSLLVYCLSSEY